MEKMVAWESKVQPHATVTNDPSISKNCEIVCGATVTKTDDSDEMFNMEAALQNESKEPFSGNIGMIVGEVRDHLCATAQTRHCRSQTIISYLLFTI
jgi:hypothetical protein